MPIKGMTPKEELIVKDVLGYFAAKKSYEFFYYGSRVKGDYRRLSDLDILVKGKAPLENLDFIMLRTIFDNSDLPYVVNLTDYYNLREDFYKSIEQDLVKIEV